MATCKNVSAGGASEEISSSQFLVWDPLHISVTNEARKLKFGTLVVICHLRVLAPGIKIFPVPLFMLVPPHISETNRVRKLKICRYCGYM